MIYVSQHGGSAACGVRSSATVQVLLLTEALDTLPPRPAAERGLLLQDCGPQQSLVVQRDASQVLYVLFIAGYSLYL